MRLRLLEFLDNRHMKMVMFSALYIDPMGIVRPKKICQRKIFMSPSGIETATFRLVAQCLKNCATTCPIHILQKRIKLHLEPTKSQMAFWDVMVKFGSYVDSRVQKNFSSPS